MSAGAQSPHATFGPYEIVRPLGAGGMAETSIAVRRGPGGFEQRVCLKRILPAFNSDARFVEMFLSEARLAARLRHNNVVQVYDFGQVDGSYYLSLELVDGLDLRALLTGLRDRGEALSTDLRVYIVFEVLSSLSYAHGLSIDGAPAGLVHRDVTPSNILVSLHGEVKLADFGIAKATETTLASQTGSVKGKIPYMAPEQAEGRRVDARTDLFAVGVILYELFAGRRPFDGATDTATLMNICRGQYTTLGDAAPDAPEALVSVVDRLLAHDPEERFQTAVEVSDALVDLVPSPLARRTLGKLVARLRPPTVSPSVAAAPTASLPVDDTRSGVRRSDSGEPGPLETLALDSEPEPAPEPPRASTSPTPTRRGLLGPVLLAALVLLGAAITIGLGEWLSPKEALVVAPPGNAGSASAAGESPSRTGAASATGSGTGVQEETGPAAEEGAQAEAGSATEAEQETDTASGTEPAARAETASETGPERLAARAATTQALADAEDEDETSGESRERGQVRVMLIPFGDVWVDGVHRGTAQSRGLVLTLPPGPHRIDVGRNGQREESAYVQVRPRRTLVHRVDLRDVDPSPM